MRTPSWDRYAFLIAGKVLYMILSMSYALCMSNRCLLPVELVKSIKAYHSINFLRPALVLDASTDTS